MPVGSSQGRQMPCPWVGPPLMPLGGGHYCNGRIERTGKCLARGQVAFRPSKRGSCALNESHFPLQPIYQISNLKLSL